MTRPRLDPPRGLLGSARPFSHARYYPSASLTSVVEHYWVVRWDLGAGQSHRQELLPHPSVQLVVETDRAEVVGVVTGRFSRVLIGRGRVFGIKLRPGAFYPFAQRPVSEFTDRTVPLVNVFGSGTAVYRQAVVDAVEDAALVDVAETFLLTRLPEPDEHVARAGRVVDHIAACPEIGKVEDLSTIFDIGKRTLQRLFKRYVGVSPKWVIQRYRLHEALARVDAGRPIQWARLASQLGYVDQAHFIKTFGAYIGQTPSEYVKSAVATPNAQLQHLTPTLNVQHSTSNAQRPTFNTQCSTLNTQRSTSALKGTTSS